MYTAIMATTIDAPFVDQAIASILEQSTPPDRILVILNGPKAAESGLIEHLSSLSDLIEVRASARPGQAPAFAQALSEVVTPFVAFLDDDDLWDSGKQTAQIMALNADPEAEVAIGLVANFRDTATGGRVIDSPNAARLFSACTFRTGTFLRIGAPDPEADHFTWLYRWWDKANQRGITTVTAEGVALLRRVHGENSWVRDNQRGKRQLHEELRRILRDRQHG